MTVENDPLAPCFGRVYRGNSTAFELKPLGEALAEDGAAGGVDARDLGDGVHDARWHPGGTIVFGGRGGTKREAIDNAAESFRKWADVVEAEIREEAKKHEV